MLYNNRNWFNWLVFTVADTAWQIHTSHTRNLSNRPNGLQSTIPASGMFLFSSARLSVVTPLSGLLTGGHAETMPKIRLSSKLLGIQSLGQK